MKVISAPRSGFFFPRVLLAFALCSVGVLLAMFSFAAASMTLNPIGPRWSIVKSPNVGSPGTNQLYATTCAAASDCWAVGYSDTGSGYNTLIEHWDGSAWTIVPSPNSVGNNILQGVTCVSSSDCWAVGNADEPDVHQRTLVEHWDGNGWSIVPSPNRGLSSPPIDVLAGVACISASECWAAYSERCYE